MKLFFITILCIFMTGCIFKTNETEIGVKISKFAPFGTKGVQKNVFASGQYHFYIPLFSEFKKFDTRLQTIKMTYDPNTGDRRSRDDLLFKTIDGNDISLDVIIQYRIIPKLAPIILQQVGQSDWELKMTIIRTVCRSVPRDIFGELKTEEFYITQARDEKSEQVKKALNDILNPLGVMIETVLTEDYRFNQAYQKAIEDKKVADQMAEKNKSATAAAREEYKRKIEEAMGEVNKMKAKADGQYAKEKIEVDAYYEKMKLLADAIKKEGETEAKGIAKYNQALAGSGGRTMVKLELAKALKGKKIVLLPLSAGGMNLKTTNINDLLSTYGLMSFAGQTPNSKKENKE